MGGLLQAKRESFTVLPRAPSLRGLSPKVTGGVKFYATNGSGLRGFYTSISFPSSSEQMPL